MEFKRCYGCMRELDVPGAVCPHCGYDNVNDLAGQPNHALTCGTVLGGRYVLGRVLGQGGFGISYIGWNLTMEIPVCLKEYFPDGAAMRSATQSRLVFWGASENAQNLKQSRESFVKEARKAVKLRDLNHVVKVWDVFYENETAYIVMDYIEGETLKDKLLHTQKPLGEKECVELLTPVMQDLEKAHARGIIHRDIKPENIMLDAEGEPILLDMGAAKDLAKSARNGSTLSSALVVSQGFSPREQYREHGNIGPWTDVYAMCATICYCVTGKVPPTPMDREDGETVDLSAFSPAVAQVLEKGLALKIEDRIQSIGELLNALTAALANPNVKPEPPKPKPPKPEPPKPEPPKPESPKPEPSRKKNRLVPVLAFAAALLIAAGVYFMKGRQTDIVLTPPPSTDVTAAMTETPTPTETPEPTPTPTASPDGAELFERGLACDENENYTEAMEWYLKAADAGNAAAMVYIGNKYYYGQGVSQDYGKAMEWYLKAADAGKATAMYNIGYMYEHGGGVNQDYEKAMEWYLKAADTGNAYAMFKIGRLYGFGHGVNQNYGKAMEWYLKAADAGNTDAMNNIGILYDYGHGVSQDYGKAMEWYLKAADAGNATAMNWVGDMYQYGQGVTADSAKAKEWHQKAKDAGYTG